MKQEVSIITTTEIMSIGKAFHESGMFTDVKSAAQAVVKIQAGAEMGIPPFAAMSGIHIIQGKPTVGAGLMAANVKGSGKYDYRVVESTEKVCSIDFYQQVFNTKTGGHTMEKIGNSTFTLDDAKKAGTKNLDKFPKNMLFARAISNGVKWYTPDVFSGPVYVPEEMTSPITEDVGHEEVKINITSEPENTNDAEKQSYISEAISQLESYSTKGELTKFKKELPAYIVSDASFIEAGKKRYDMIMAEAAKV